MVLFCNYLPSCIAAKDGWPDIAAEYPDVKFLNIDTTDYDYGGIEITANYKNYRVKDRVIEMKVPSVILFKNGVPSRRIDAGSRKNVIKLLQ